MHWRIKLALIHVNITKSTINMQKAALYAAFQGCDTAVWHIVAPHQTASQVTRSGG